MADTAAARRRRPSVGGYARGEETRARIVAAALRVFGEEGYERASTRQIAEAAGVKPPALQYYFDSKEGLHRACAEQILGLAEPLLEAAAEAERRDRPLQGAAAAVDALCDVLEAFLDMSLQTRRDPGGTRFLARIQAEGAGPGLPLIRERLIRPIHDMCSRLVARALGDQAADADVRLRATVLLAQLSAFGPGRQTTLAMLDWPDFAGERRAAIRAVLRAHTMGALARCQGGGSELADRVEGAG